MLGAVCGAARRALGAAARGPLRAGVAARGASGAAGEARTAPESHYDSDVEEESAWLDLLDRQRAYLRGARYPNPLRRARVVPNRALVRHGLKAIQLGEGRFSEMDAETLLDKFGDVLGTDKDGKRGGDSEWNREYMKAMLLDGFDPASTDRAYVRALENMLTEVVRKDYHLELFERLRAVVPIVDNPNEEEGGEGDVHVPLTHEKVQEHLERKNFPREYGREQPPADEPLRRKMDSMNRTTKRVRFCEGRKQQIGNKPFRCHVVDLREINHTNLRELGRFIGARAQILPRRHTGLCAKCQRNVAKTIRRARYFGFLPYIEEPIYKDMRRFDPTKLCLEAHDGSETVYSETI